MKQEDMTEEVVQALAAAGDYHFDFNRCGGCQEPTMVYLRGGVALFDSSCGCSRSNPRQISMKEAADLLQKTGFPNQFESLEKPEIKPPPQRPEGYWSLRAKAMQVNIIYDPIGPLDIIAYGVVMTRTEQVYHNGMNTLVPMLYQEVIYWYENQLRCGAMRCPAI